MIAAQILDSGAIYLIIGAGLIFGACAYAAKRILRQLTLKQLWVIGGVTLATLGLIWGFLTLGTRKHEPARTTPDLTQPERPQPAPD